MNPDPPVTRTLRSPYMSSHTCFPDAARWPTDVARLCMADDCGRRAPAQFPAWRSSTQATGDESTWRARPGHQVCEDHPVRITVLAGGVGGAKFLLGVKEFLGFPPFGAPDDGSAAGHRITAIVNTADDIRLHNLQICPDLDSCMYTLAGAADLQRGWGRRPRPGPCQPNSPATAPRRRGSPWATRTSPPT